MLSAGQSKIAFNIFFLLIQWSGNADPRFIFIFLNTSLNNNNNNVHLSCAHQHPERSHDTY